MNTIMIYEKDIETIANYKNSRRFEGFVFDEFRLILKRNDFKIVYKIRMNKNVNEVSYRMINDGSYHDCKFSFIEKEEGFEYIEKPNGELVDLCVSRMVNTYGATKSNDEIINSIMRIYNAEIHFLLQFKQYVMNESYERKTIQKEARTTVGSESKGKNVNYRSRKQVVEFLLDDIVEYVSHSGRNRSITCECWGVRGHFRHYKNGKVAWISAYEKGTKRNTGHRTDTKTYVM